MHHYNSTQYCKTETVFSIYAFLQTNITSQMSPSGGKGPLYYKLCRLQASSRAKNQINPLITITTFNQAGNQMAVNPVIPTLKLHSNGPLYSNTVTDWYTGRWRVGCYIWYSKEGPGAAAQSPPHCTNITAHPSMASVPTSYYLMWHYNCLWPLKG